MDKSPDPPLPLGLPAWGDMQGLILSVYPHLDRAEYCLFQIDDPARARAWLGTLIGSVTPALKKSHGERYGDVNVNIAFSWKGLEKLSRFDGRPLAKFTFPFMEGIAGRGHRRRMLGDTGASDPSGWAWGGADPEKSVDVLLMVFARDAAKLAGALEACKPPPGATTAFTHHVTALPLGEANRREHFGFVDGISQPILKNSHEAEHVPESRHLTELGEIVLGYRNADGACAEVPMLADCRFGENGTYLVARQIEQNVLEFMRYVNEKSARHGRVDEHAAEQLASKIVGREPDGTPLVPYANRQDNEFGFAEDPYGYGCPIGSHIRRTNPRDSFDNNNLPSKRASLSNRHRILRRGRSYGPKLTAATRDERRGLMFICLNADLERQFEFIQQNWVNSPAFFGLSDERDPLIGDQGADPTGRCPFTIPGLPAPTRVDGLPRFVTVRGGEYFFLPGLRALRCLAGEAGMRAAYA